MLYTLPIYVRHTILAFYWRASGNSVFEKLFNAVKKAVDWLVEKRYVMRLIDGSLMMSARGVRKQKDYLRKVKREVLRKKEIYYYEILFEAHKKIR